MKDKTIKITLKYFAICLDSRAYEAVKIQNAVAPEFENPENVNEQFKLRIGDRISEKAAESLSHRYEVTIIPA